MQVKWALSQFHVDDAGNKVPFVADYGGGWDCPVMPTTSDGWALVQIYLNQQQVQASSLDNRVVICPLLFDPRQIPQKVIDAYPALATAVASGITPLSISTALAILSDSEPRYGHTI